MFAELKRHRVYSVAVAYVVGSWLLIQVATQVFPFFEIPNSVVRLVVLLTIAGFPITLAAVWAFELKSGTQRPASRRLTALLILRTGVATSLTIFCFLPSQSESLGNKSDPAEIDLHSIAVLPFDNLSTDESNAYFVRGMRDEILTSLAQPRDLNVRSRTSTRRYQKNPESLAAIGRDAHRWLGWYLARVERDFDRGEAELEKARALDPFYTWPLMFKCFIEIARGKYAKAMQFAQRVMEIDPRFFYDVDPIACVYATEERWEEAATRYNSLPVEFMSKPNFQLAICFTHLGKKEEARRILTDLESLAQSRYIDQIHIAAIYGALGEKDKAFAALDQATAARSARVSTPRFYSWLAPLFSDPRFAELEYKVSHSALLAPQ